MRNSHPIEYFCLVTITIAMVSMVTCQDLPSVCTTDYYRDLPLNMQSEHQCLLLEHFNSEFNNDREDRVRRYKELNVGLQDINYKLDLILADLDPEEYKEKKTKDKESSVNDKQPEECVSDFKPNMDLKPYYKDCYDLKTQGHINVTGVYPVRVPGSDVVLVLCDMDRGGGGWTVIQRRVDGSVNFNRNWTEYKYGFGNPNTEYWLGLEYIHKISTNQNTSLRVDLWDWDGKRSRAEYLIFHVGNDETKYTLTVSGFRGNAGDSLSYHSNCSFSTPDVDNDVWPGNCALQDGAGWWYKGCSYAALNSAYHTRQEVEGSVSGTLDGILWYHWKEKYTYPLPKVEMKIRRAFV